MKFYLTFMFYNKCVLIKYKCNHIVFIKIAICRKSVRVVLASKVTYPVSCNPIKDIMVSFDGRWMKRLQVQVWYSFCNRVLYCTCNLL